MPRSNTLIAGSLGPATLGHDLVRGWWKLDYAGETHFLAPDSVPVWEAVDASNIAIMQIDLKKGAAHGISGTGSTAGSGGSGGAQSGGQHAGGVGGDPLADQCWNCGKWAGNTFYGRPCCTSNACIGAIHAVATGKAKPAAAAAGHPVVRTGIPAGKCTSHSGVAGSTAAPSYPLVTWPALVDWQKPRTAPIPISEILIGEIVAWRAWHVESGYLKSYSQDVVWPPGEPVTGKVPSGEDGGGIHAFRDRRRLFEFMKNGGPMVWGSVALWGDIVEHELGYRAENAAVRSIDGSYPGGAVKDGVLAGLRRVYGVAG